MQLHYTKHTLAPPPHDKPRSMKVMKQQSIRPFAINVFVVLVHGSQDQVHGHRHSFSQPQLAYKKNLLHLHLPLMETKRGMSLQAQYTQIHYNVPEGSTTSCPNGSGWAAPFYPMGEVWLFLYPRPFQQ